MSASVEYDPRLVEEAVLRRIAGHPQEGEYRTRRDRIYELSDPARRAAAFSELDGEWFARLGLDRPLLQALAEVLPEASVERVLVGRARSAAEEAADLLVARDGSSRCVLVRLRPERFLDPQPLFEWLRRELWFVADMLDPAFRYEPRLPASNLGPSGDRRLRERYRLLWEITIDGRLLRVGLGLPETRDRRRAEFLRFFPELPEETFARLFDGPRPSHPQLVEIALAAESRSRCPLCGFPAPLVSAREVSEPVRQAIAAEFPSWEPDRGLCRRCAELFDEAARACASRGARSREPQTLGPHAPLNRAG
jgi:hypothetical protein